MNTLAQALREALTELDTAKAIDSAYREMFSTFAKKPLRPGETWRLRLLQWCEREEALAQAPLDYAIDHPPYRGQGIDN